MRVLLANKYFYPRGGAEKSTFLVDELLRGAGHETIHLSTRDARNRPSPWADHFLPGVDHGKPAWHPASWGAGARALGWGVRGPVRRLVEASRPDVAILQNVYHQLGAPALIDTLADLGVPAILFLRDFRVVCPAYSLFREQSPCEACAGGRVRPAVANRCGGSWARSVLMAESARREQARYGRLRRIAAPSRFLIDKVKEMGFPYDVSLRRNAVVPPAEPADPGAGEVFGFAGRLHPHKGLAVLLDAAARLPHVRFRVAGAGPVALDAPQNVELLGALDPVALERERRTWRAEIVPSIWYENCPNSVLEAQALALPVIASDRGGLPELVEGRGLLFPAGDAARLADAVEALRVDPDRARALGRAGRAFVEAECAPASLLATLEQWLAEAVT